MFKKIRNKAVAALSWVQKTTKTDVFYLAKGGLWLTTGDIIISALSFILAIFYANFVSKEIYGTYRYILSATGMLAVFSLGGMGTAITRAVAQDYEGSLMPAVKKSIQWGTVSGILSVILATYYFFQNNNTLGFAFLIIAGFLPVKDSLGLYHSWLAGKKFFNLSSLFSVGSQLVAVLCLFVAAYFGRSVYLLILAYFAPKVIMHLIFLIRTKRLISTNAKQDPDLISYGMHLSFMGILSEFAGQLDKILVWSSLGAIPLALYSFASAPIVQMRNLINVIFPLSFPKLARRTPAELQASLPFKLGIMFVIILVAVLAYIVSAKFLFGIFFSKYMDAVLLSQVFAVSLLFLPRGILTDAINIHAPKKILYFMSISASILRIILLLFLVKYFGIMGAILAYIGLEIYLSIISAYLFFKKM